MVDEDCASCEFGCESGGDAGALDSRESGRLLSPSLLTDTSVSQRCCSACLVWFAGGGETKGSWRWWWW
jgi:hypothetical protein